MNLFLLNFCIYFISKVFLSLVLVDIRLVEKFSEFNATKYYNFDTNEIVNSWYAEGKNYD